MVFEATTGSGVNQSVDPGGDLIGLGRAGIPRGEAPARESRRSPRRGPGPIGGGTAEQADDRRPRPRDLRASREKKPVLAASAKPSSRASVGGTGEADRAWSASPLRRVLHRVEADLHLRGAGRPSDDWLRRGCRSPRCGWFTCRSLPCVGAKMARGCPQRASGAQFPLQGQEVRLDLAGYGDPQESGAKGPPVERGRHGSRNSSKIRIRGVDSPENLGRWLRKPARSARRALQFDVGVSTPSLSSAFLSVPQRAPRKADSRSAETRAAPIPASAAAAMVGSGKGRGAWATGCEGRGVAQRVGIQRSSWSVLPHMGGRNDSSPSRRSRSGARRARDRPRRWSAMRPASPGGRAETASPGAGIGSSDPALRAPSVGSVPPGRGRSTRSRARVSRLSLRTGQNDVAQDEGLSETTAAQPSRPRPPRWACR